MADRFPSIPGYAVEAELGRGGMGVVYRVRQQATGSTLALKMILSGRGASFHELARFRVEAEAMACLNHPNITKIRDVGVASGYPFFALEFAARGSLKQVIQGRPQAVRWSVELVRTLSLAMQHAHGRGMLHRDLKPANILFLDDGTPKISDFGLVKFAAPIERVSEACCTFSVSPLDAELMRFARELGAQYESVSDAAGTDEELLTRSVWEQCAARTGTLKQGTQLQSVRAFLTEARRQAGMAPGLDDLTRTGAVMGSPSYMAPEQASGNLKSIGPPTDVYALGGILYELFTGQPVFSPLSRSDLWIQMLTEPPRPPGQLRPGLPAEAERICLRCLEKDPGRRYPSAQALADELARVLESCEPIPNDPDPSTAARSSEPSTPSEGGRTASERPSVGPAGPTRTRTWWPFGRKTR
jgi:serine/threonine protein kinase